MKRTKVLMVLVAMAVMISACGESEKGNNVGENKQNQDIENSQSPKEEDENKKEIKSEYTINGITISAKGFSVEPYKDSSEKYTKRIIVEFTINNNSDSAFGYITSWEGKLPDGYKLNGWTDIMSMSLKQVPSGGKKTDKAYFLIDDSIDPSEIIVSYNFMEYGEEYWKDFGKIMTGEMGQEEYEKKYGNYEVLEFDITK